MSCEQKRVTILFLLELTVSCHVCHSVSLGHRGDGFSTNHVPESTSPGWGTIKPDEGDWRLAEKAIRGADLRKSRIREHRSQPAAPNRNESDSNFTAWTVGHVGTHLKGSPSADGFQADFTGFHGVQGTVLGPSFDSSPNLSQWLEMRPLVLCDEDVMTFIASRQGLTHLLVDRVAASPISLLQLPPHCGYSVRTSWSELEMMAPYDACYISQENDSYVLPMLWWGSPLKLSCPVELSTAAPPPPTSVPSVLCSTYGMAVQIRRQELGLPMGVTVNGARGPFVSGECAELVHTKPDELTFFISFKASCITAGEALHLQLVVDNHEYVLSCPVSHQVPYIQDPVPPAPPTHPPPPPQLPTKEQVPQPPDFPYPGFFYPQVYLPGPQPGPPRPAPDSPPGYHPQQPNYPLQYGTLPYSPEKHPPHPPPPYQPPEVVQETLDPDLSLIQESHSHQMSALPFSQYSSVWYYYHMPFYYPAVPTSETPTFPATDPPGEQTPSLPEDLYHSQYHLHIPYYPAPTAPPVTQTPALPSQTPPPPLPPLPSLPEQPVAPQQPVSPFYSPYDHYGTVYHPSSYHYYPYYHHFYPTHYHPPYTLVPQYPESQTPITTIQPRANTTTTTAVPTTSTTATTPSALPTAPTHHLQCLLGSLVVVLRFAHPDSIQVRDQMKTWVPLSRVSPHCGYTVQIGGAGVILHSPLPACHSQSQTPTTISLPLRFWDLSTLQYETLDLQCPYESTPETPAPATTTVAPPTLPTTTTTTPTTPPVPKPRVICSSHYMTVKLPPGPISDILLKDMEGNQVSLQYAPDHCGYSASTGKDGKIHLSLQLHTRCHMTVQGKMYIISVVYMTTNGRRETRVSCPVVVPERGKECSLPSKQRLPCGPAFVSQTQCLSMGCCFSKHPPACYYPMDECTIDHHFVFSVPATIIEPPISPALLVAASNSTCKPERVTADYALFKIPMDACGTRRVVVGKMVIYMVEIINRVQGISLYYGTITRDSPVRFLVECWFDPGSLLTVSYLVKTPTFGPGVQTKEVFGVQLRIAKDAEYNSYYPQYHQPLQMLLGKPLYLEVRLLNAPDPGVLLLVHFCVAYPRSGQSVWVLLYNGCPNPLDPAPHRAALSDPQPASPKGQTRRFTISTFQFLPDGEFKDPNEEIYFMCSTEICSPRDGSCVEGCFGQ